MSTATTAMEVDQRPQAKRRKLYNLNNEEVASGGLAKPTLNPELNKKMRKLVMHIHEVFAVAFGFTEADMLNLDETMKVTSVIWTIYTLAKQEANNSGNVRNKVKDDDKITVNNFECEVATLKALFRDVTGKYGLEFNNTPASKDVRGTFQMQLCLMYAFRFRCNEGVYLNNLYKKGEIGGVEKAIDVHAWGVKVQHLAFTYGANFPPAMQSALMQQLGPASLLIGLCEATNPDYQKKWINAVVSQLAGVPHIASIANLLAGSRDKHANIVTTVLDIAVLGVARQAHKGSFPWAMLRALNSQNAAFVAWTKGIEVAVTENTRSITNTNAVILDAAMDKDTLAMDFSGKGMWFAYHRLCEIPFQMKMIAGANEQVYRQWLSFSVTGLWGEDTAVLRHIFGVPTIRRSQYGNAFVERRTKGVLKPVTLFPAFRVCKLASAAQSKLGAVDRYIGIRNPSVSGKCFSPVGADDPRLTLLDDAEGSRVITSVGNNRIADALSDHKRKMSMTIRNEGGISYGTTSWYIVDDSSSRECYGTVSEDVLQLDNKFVFSQD